MLADERHDLGPERLRHELRDHGRHQQVRHLVADVQEAVEVGKEQRREYAAARARDDIGAEKA